MGEYNLKYVGLIGNVFHTTDIDAAIEKGRQLVISFDKIVKNSANSYTQKSVGPDSGLGSSAFGVCITELRDGIVNVLHAEEYPRLDFNEMIDITVKLLEEYDMHGRATERRDFQSARGCLSDNLSVVSSLNSFNGAETYLKYLELQTEARLISDIKKEFADSNDVCILHEFKLGTSPVTIPVCSWFHVDDDEKISS